MNVARFAALDVAALSGPERKGSRILETLLWKKDCFGVLASGSEREESPWEEPASVVNGGAGRVRGGFSSGSDDVTLSILAAEGSCVSASIIRGVETATSCSSAINKGEEAASLGREAVVRAEVSPELPVAKGSWV